MKESHVLDIRKKTVEERLRGDHIDLLYQLDDSLKLNEKYEKEIDQLKELLSTTQKPATEIVVEENGEVIASHLRTIEELQSTISSQNNELKTIKTKDALTLKSHKKQVEDIQAELNKVSSEAEESNKASELRIRDLEKQLFSEKEKNKIETPVYASSGDNIVGELEHKCEVYEKQILNLKDEIQKKEDIIIFNENKYVFESNKRKEIYEKQKGVILDLESEKCHISSELSEAHIRIKDLLSKLEIANQNNVVKPLEEAINLKDTCVLDVSTQTEDIDKDTDMKNQFKDYVQLKKENMTLKLQLASKESSKSRSMSDTTVLLGSQSSYNTSGSTSSINRNVSQSSSKNPLFPTSKLNKKERS